MVVEEAEARSWEGAEAGVLWAAVGAAAPRMAEEVRTPVIVAKTGVVAHLHWLGGERRKTHLVLA